MTVVVVISGTWRRNSGIAMKLFYVEPGQYWDGCGM